MFDGTPWYENQLEGAIYTGAGLYKIICNICDYDENFNTTTSFTGTIYGYDNSTAQKIDKSTYSCYNIKKDGFTKVAICTLTKFNHQR